MSDIVVDIEIDEDTLEEMHMQSLIDHALLQAHVCTIPVHELHHMRLDECQTHGVTMLCDNRKVESMPDCNRCGKARTPDSWLHLSQEHPSMCDRSCEPEPEARSSDPTSPV